MINKYGGYAGTARGQGEDSRREVTRWLPIGTTPLTRGRHLLSCGFAAGWCVDLLYFERPLSAAFGALSRCWNLVVRSGLAGGGRGSCLRRVDLTASPCQ